MKYEELAKDIFALAAKHKFDIQLPNDKTGDVGDIQVLIDTKKKMVTFCPTEENFDLYSKKGIIMEMFEKVINRHPVLTIAIVGILCLLGDAISKLL